MHSENVSTAQRPSDFMACSTQYGTKMTFLVIYHGLYSVWCIVFTYYIALHCICAILYLYFHLYRGGSRGGGVTVAGVTCSHHVLPKVKTNEHRNKITKCSETKIC